MSVVSGIIFQTSVSRFQIKNIAARVCEYSVDLDICALVY